MGRGVTRICQGGTRIIFVIFENLLVAKRHAAHGKARGFARGLRGHTLMRFFFKMVQFGAFWCTFGSDLVINFFIITTFSYIK